MTIYVGGLRSRLIRESVFQMIQDSLDSLDWFNPARKHTPINLTPNGVDDRENVPKNTAALSDYGLTEQEEEMGSKLSEFRRVYYVDFYAEDDAIGLHFIDDVKDILAGRMPSIGRDFPNVPVWDYTAATPSVILTVEIEHIVVDRPEVFERPWQRFMRTVRFEIVDYYGDESDS